MQLNLAKWLNKPSITGYGMLIGGGEECTPMVNTLTDLVVSLIGSCHIRAFNADRYFDISVITDIVNSASLFADKNLIILTFKIKPTAEQQKRLISTFDLLGENNFLLICCDKLDKKDFTANWVNWFIQNAMLFNLVNDQNDTIAWTQFCLDKAELQIEPAALELLISLNQNNLGQLNQEITRLELLYNVPATITLNAAKEHLLDNSSYNIYALSSAYLSGNLELMQKIFANLCITSEDVILISWGLGEDLRKLIKIKNLAKGGADFRTIAGSLRIWGDMIRGFQLANQRLNYGLLLDYLQNLAQIDMAVKGVINAAPVAMLEGLLINICCAR